MPTPAITTLRATIAAALTDNTLYQTFDFPPATILANSLIVSPAEPYITPSNNMQLSVAPLANFRLMLTVPMFDNKGNLNGIESAIVGVIAKLIASSIIFNISSVSAPSILNAASGDLLLSEITISVLTSWS